MIKFVHRLYGLLVTVTSSFQSVLLLVVRLYWGWQFAQTGWGKLFHLDRVTQFFASLGIPVPGLNAVLVSELELGGGVLLALGLASRPLALLLAGDMVVAYVTADRAALFSAFSNPDKFMGAAPFTYLCASLLILIFGPGRFSLDALAQRWFAKRAGGLSPAG